jgi:hypothetical protein
MRRRQSVFQRERLLCRAALEALPAVAAIVPPIADPAPMAARPWKLRLRQWAMTWVELQKQVYRKAKEVGLRRSADSARIPGLMAPRLVAMVQDSLAEIPAGPPTSVMPKVWRGTRPPTLVKGIGQKRKQSCFSSNSGGVNVNVVWVYRGESRWNK